MTPVSTNIINDFNNFPVLENKRNFAANQDLFFPNAENNKNKGTYFVIKSSHNDKEFINLNPFWIQKGIDGITTDIERISKQRDGSLLVLSKSEKGSLALKKAARFGNLFDISVEEHPFLNNTKGLIYCYDLKQMEQNDILKELESQGVVYVHAMTKVVNGVRSATGLYVITFKSMVLPPYIKIGYLNLKVKIYIPNPMRCVSCQIFGHTQKNCTSPIKVCAQCSNTLPHAECGPTKCLNCKQEHNSSSKDCPIYTKESKIMEIKTLENISISEARRRYTNRTITPQNSFLDVTNDNHLILKEIDELRNELQSFKQKDAEYKEKIQSEITKNASLVDLNSKLVIRIKNCELNNKRLLKENNELKKLQSKSIILQSNLIKKRGRPTRKVAADKNKYDEDMYSSDYSETHNEDHQDALSNLDGIEEITMEDPPDLTPNTSKVLKK